MVGRSKVVPPSDPARKPRVTLRAARFFATDGGAMAQTAHGSSNAARTRDLSIERGAAGRRQSPVESCTARPSASGHGCLRCDVRHLALCAALREDELPHLEAIVSAVSLGPGRTLFGEGRSEEHTSELQ